MKTTKTLLEAMTKEELEEIHEPDIGGTSEEMKVAAGEFLHAMQFKKKYSKREEEKKNLFDLITSLFGGEKK